jgi:hypothetical protein
VRGHLTASLGKARITRTRPEEGDVGATLSGRMASAAERASTWVRRPSAADTMEEPVATRPFVIVACLRKMICGNKTGRVDHPQNRIFGGKARRDSPERGYRDVLVSYRDRYRSAPICNIEKV